jgi:Mrp family chromosome partitioning ATPase
MEEAGPGDGAPAGALARHVVLVLSGKGGVGKSTVACQMALMLALEGRRVGILDVDICGPSVPKILGVEGREVGQGPEGWRPIAVPLGEGCPGELWAISTGFLVGPDDAIVWRGPRKNAMIKQFFTDVRWGALDFLIVDTPPGTSDEHIATCANVLPFHPSGAVIVTTPQEVSLDDVRKELDFCRAARLPVLGIVENMAGFVCPHCAECTFIFSTGGGEKLAAAQGVPFLGRVPLDPTLAACEDEGRAFVSHFPSSPSASALRTIVANVAQGCGAAAVPI